MKALRMERRPTRFVAAYLASTFGSGRGAGVGPLRLGDGPSPRDLGPGWTPVTPLLAGICGSDLATVDGRASRSFESIVSFPFIPGHEIVALAERAGIDAHGQAFEAGTRIAIQPVLGCAARGLALCRFCQASEVGRCGNLAHGHLRPGLQTGYCADTGGGWSDGPLMAHQSQIFVVPEVLTDDEAVMVEPMACALHAALRCPIDVTDTVAVIGAGTLGLGVIGALNFLSDAYGLARPHKIIVGAKYSHQQRSAKDLGATDVVEPKQLDRAVRAAVHAGSMGFSGHLGELSGGANVTFDCVGSADSIAQALRITAPGGRIVLVGMPGKISVDLAPLWRREIELIGAYAYGVEQLGDVSIPTFDLAFEFVVAKGLGNLVSARYPIDRFEEALAHAGQAGSRGATKIVFESSRSTKHRKDDA